MATVAHKRDRRLIRKLDLSPEVQQAFEWFMDELTDGFGLVRGSLVDAIEDGTIDPTTPTTINAEVGQVVRGHRSAISIVFENGTERGANAGVELARRRYPIEISFDRVPQRVLDEFGEWSQEAVDSSLDTLTRDVTDLVRGAQEEGLSIDAIAEQVGDMVDNRYVSDNPWKAQQIARTATIPSSNAGSHATYDDAESVAAEEWLDASDARVRRTHREADGQVTAVGTQFEVGVATARFPGDPTLPLGELINCRCTSIPVFPDQLTDDQLDTIQAGGRVWT